MSDEEERYHVCWTGGILDINGGGKSEKTYSLAEAQMECIQLNRNNHGHSGADTLGLSASYFYEKVE
jgi:hypothetical protein